MVLPKPPSNDRTPHEIAPQESSRAEIDEFLAQMRSSPSAKPAGQGRLIFAMDATMSRRPSWDMALAVQAEMFNAVKAVGGLDVQLVFFRGFDECRASRWVSDAAALCPAYDRCRMPRRLHPNSQGFDARLTRIGRPAK